MIVKHTNPCGVAVGESIEEAYEVALAADPVSAYGGVVVLNRAVSAALASKLAEQFVEVLFAPGYDEVALDALIRKQSIRTSTTPSGRQAKSGERDYKRVLGGLLVQDRDWDVEDREDGGRDRRADGGAVGRPPVRRPRLQARRLERDRDRQGLADDRDRSRTDEPGRRRPDRAREGERSTATRSTEPHSPPDAFFPFPTALSSHSTPAWTRSSSRAARSATST